VLTTGVVCPLTILSACPLFLVRISAGVVRGRYRRKVIDFGLNCLSLSPTDIDFITTEKDPAFRTTEKYYDWGVKITVMDCNGEPMAIIKENLLHSFAHTPRAEYVVELPDGQEVARSKQGSFLSDTLMIFNTDEDEDGDGEVSGEEAEAAADKPPEPLAYARISKGAKLRGQFCLGGTWRLNINEYATNFWEDPRTREVLMVLTTVKAVRDTDRDAEGRVHEARSHFVCVSRVQMCLSRDDFVLGNVGEGGDRGLIVVVWIVYSSGAICGRVANGRVERVKVIDFCLFLFVARGGAQTHT